MRTVMTSEETRILIEKYLDGTTTNAEESRLRQYFGERPAADVPEEWRVYKALFAWETEHAAAGDAAKERAAEDDRPAGKTVRRAVMRRINVLLGSAAASVAVLIAVAVGHVPQADRQCYAVIDGRVYTDCDFVEREAEAALTLVAGSEDDAFDALQMMKPRGGDATNDEQ